MCVGGSSNISVSFVKKEEEQQQLGTFVYASMHMYLGLFI